ncbi:hypothetical protein [Streptomyces sp. URMC 129]|uniref:hypothetical protein n=1 Tax=Streptomyces sp. URMC 129 TaxID=3423407 RepID=UPI003F1DCCF3
MKAALESARLAAAEATVAERLAKIDEHAMRLRWYRYFTRGRQGPLPEPDRLDVRK